MHRASIHADESVDLVAFGVPILLRLRGSGARKLGAALLSAWQWCLPSIGHLPSIGQTEEAVVLDLMLDDNPAVVAAARRSGHLAGGDLIELMHRLTSRITTEAIGRRAGELLMMHACAVADPVTGATVVLVGPSGMGKTTAARALATSWGYVTDEAATLRPDGTMLAYPKPLSVVRPGASGVKDQVGPAALGLVRPPERLHLAAVVLLQRSSTGPVSVEPVSTLPALAALAEHTSYLAKLPAPLHLMADLLRGAGGLRRVTYRHADQLAPVVADLIGARR